MKQKTTHNNGVCFPPTRGHAPLLCFVFVIFTIVAQAQCPNFTNITAPGVKAFTGNTSNPFATQGVVTGRHSLITTQGSDPNTGGALQLLPAGETSVIRLGNEQVGAEAEALSYSFTVDKNNPVLLVKFAVVMEDPGHSSIQQPRFVIRITDQNGDLVEDCAEYDVSAREDIPGFQSYQKSAHTPVRWRDWTNVGLDMSRFAGQQVQVQFITYDCTQTGHFGYAYFTAKCIPNRLELDACAGNSFTLEAPKDFESYRWSNGETGRIATFNTAASNDKQLSCLVTSATGCQFPLYAFVTTNPSGTVQTGNFTDVICEGETYAKHNFNLPPQSAGTHFYQNVIVNPAACTDNQEINLTLTVVKRTTYFREAICHGQSYNANGFSVEQPAVGVFRDTIKTGTVSGCDTYNVLELTVSANLNMPNVIKGETQPCTGEIFTYTFAGAESLTRFEWIVPENAKLYKSSRFAQTIQLYFTDDTPSALQLKGENGCGSGTASLNITPRKSYSIQKNEEICQGENFNMYNFNLGVQDKVGYFVYSKHLTSQFGCDSVVTLALSVLPKPKPRIEPDNAVLCNAGEEITLWALTEGMTYPGGGNGGTGGGGTGDAKLYCNEAVDDLPKPACWGCNMLSYIATVCDTIDKQYFLSEIWNNPKFLADTTDVQTLYGVGPGGGYNIVTYYITYNRILPPTQATTLAANVGRLNIYDCNLNYLWNTGATEGAITVKPTKTTEYSVEVTTQNGCSAKAKQTVVVNTNAPQTINTTICKGETYTEYGLNAKTAGIYPVSIPNGDCSITLNVNLSVMQSVVTKITDQVCAGALYQKHGLDLILIEPGIFKDTIRYRNAQGCTDITALEITVLPDEYTILRDTVCQNDTYNKNGFTLGKQEIAGKFTHTRTTTTAQNCEHSFTLQLVVNPVYTNIISDEVDKDSAYAKYGFNFPKVTKDTTATKNNLISSVGCDSTVVLNLKVKEEELNMENIDNYFQVLTCYPSNTIDVFANTATTCNRNEIKLTITSASKVGATISIDGNKNIVYTPAAGFTGFDVLEYSLECKTMVYTKKALITVMECPGNINTPDCWGAPESFEWTIKQDFIGKETNVATYVSPIVADLDGDGIPEILVGRYNRNAGNSDRIYDGIYIYWGHDRANPTFKPTVEGYFADFGFSVAKVKIKGELKPIIVMYDAHDGYLYAYDTDPAHTTEATSRIWKSNQPLKYFDMYDRRFTISFTDFDGDGEVEVYAGARIFDASTGTLLVEVPAGGNDGRFHFHGTANSSLSFSPIAADVTGDGIPEYIAGTEVYSVNITNRTGMAGNQMTLISSIPTVDIASGFSIKDGLTLVADINQDGRLDVVVLKKQATPNNQFAIMAWDVQTQTLIAKSQAVALASGWGCVGFPFIGNIDNEPNLEILVTANISSATGQIYGFRWDGNQSFNRVYSYNTTDASGQTGITLFDFNHDGIAELVYRDETHLRIMQANPATGTFTNLAIIPATSGTAQEYPVVADADGDGAAEIVVVGGTAARTEYGSLRIYKSGNQHSWAPARKVWNQYAYNVLNINEDLTVPQYLMNPARFFPNGKQPFNNFLQQQTLLNTDGDPYWAFPCSDTIFVSLCQGDSVLLGTHYYTEMGIYTDTLQTLLGKDSVVIMKLQILQRDTTSINDTIFVGESYNKHGFVIPVQNREITLSDTLHLQNQFLCDSTVILNLKVLCLSDTTKITDTIFVGESYDKHGFSIPIQTAETTLEETVHLQNQYLCDSTVILTLKVLCLSDITEIADTIFVGENYDKHGFTIPVQSAATTLSETQHLHNQFLCDSTVILNLKVLCVISDTTEIADTIFVGEDYNKNGFSIPVQNRETTLTGMLHLQNQYDCDSTVILNLKIQCIADTTQIADSIFVGESYDKHGFSIPIQTAETTLEETVHLQNQYLCDSTVILTLKVLCLSDTTKIADTIFVGESYNKYGFSIPIQTAETTLEETVHLQNQYLCDSTVILTLEVLCFSDITNIADTIFVGESYDKHGFTIPAQNAATTLSETLFLQNRYLCDSTVILTLKVMCITSDTTRITDTIFVGESYNKHGFSIPAQNAAGTVFDLLRLQNQFLCDSIVTLKLTVFPTIYKVLCESELPFTFSDTTFEKGTQSGTYIINEGLSSMTKLRLTVNPTPQFTIFNGNSTTCSQTNNTEIIAENFSPPFNKYSRFQWTVTNEQGESTVFTNCGCGESIMLENDTILPINSQWFPHPGAYRIEAVYQHYANGIYCQNTLATHYEIVEPPPPPIVASKTMCQGDITGWQAIGNGNTIWISTDKKLPDWIGETYDFDHLGLTATIEEGSYEFELYDTDALTGCESERVPATLTIARGANPKIKGRREFCHHAIEEMYKVHEVHEGSMYFWSTSGSHYNYSKDPYSAVSYVDWYGAGIDTLYVYERTNDGCEGYDTLVVSIADYPVPYYTWSLLGNTTVEFTDSSFQAPIVAKNPDGTQVEIPLTYTMEWFFDTDENRDTAVVDMFVNYRDRKKPVQVHNYTYGYKYPLLTVTNNYGCRASYVAEIFVDIPHGIQIPNAFSPTNAAASVRVFKPVAYNLEYCRVWIYDKWGNLLWYGDRVEKGLFADEWNGTYNGELLQSDVYIWKMEAGFLNGSTWAGQKKPLGGYSKFGSVVLIR